MLVNSFVHIPKVGPVTEGRIWEAGALSWEDGLEVPPTILPVKFDLVPFLEESIERLYDNDALWFSQQLAPSEQWRLFPEFSNSIAYIDIETNGRGCHSGGEITTICLWNGSELKTYVQGDNLREFQDDILDYRLLVTYNGQSFDLPFIEEWFRMSLPHAHIDLRYVLGSLGIKGGLKSCEKQLGIDRGELDGVDGMYAVYLWREYQSTGNANALETLLAYNAEDVINLEYLLAASYNRKIELTPFALANEQPLPDLTSIETGLRADRDLIDSLQRSVDERNDYLREMARMMLGR